MLFGEHAVLRRGPALVAAIDCRLSVTLSPRVDSLIDIQSALGHVTTTVSELSFGPRFRFVENAFRLFEGQLPTGVSIDIASAIDPTVGLASSASVTVALLAAVRTWLQRPADLSLLLHDSCRVIRTTQGHGSGADAASIIYGGIVCYQAEEMVATCVASTLPLVLVYSGKKTPTPDVIRYVHAQEQRFPKVYEAIFEAINDITREATMAIHANDLPLIGRLMNHAHGLMEALGVGTEALSSIGWSLRALPTIFGAKISGSGLGDAVVAVGTAERIDSGKQLPSSVASCGVEVVTCQT
jgi:mevalonate kinase